MIAFGPVPSRRLGNSLGINNIFAKHCSYSCIYCQAGRTDPLSLKRQDFYSPVEIVGAVHAKLKNAVHKSNPVDYLTFVADGEPTLDLNLDRAIQAAKSFGIKVAVITNASLLWLPEVRHSLRQADLVSLKIDAVHPKTWRRINRPHSGLKLPLIKESIQTFAKQYQGELITETMLVREINDGPEQAAALADFLKDIKPARAYLSLPVRPTQEKWAAPPTAERINRFYHSLKGLVPDLEYLTGYEGNAFAHSGNVRDDLLSITAVHPMREDAVAELLTKSSADFSEVRKLIDGGLLSEVEYRGRRYYLRNHRRIGDAAAG
jgi:wyosine [tRNA(Phe)-imidazoG37] synthetase (radical SAM superfamily)